MAVDKLVDSTQLDADLTSVANAIRTKGGTSASLAFPAEFVSAIQAIPTGGGTGLNYKTGTFTLAADTTGEGTRGTSNRIAHGFGKTPDIVIIWVDAYDRDNPPAAALNTGYTYLVGMYDIVEYNSSSQTADCALFNWHYVNTYPSLNVNNPSSNSYMPATGATPDADYFYLYKRGNSNYWLAGVTYHYFVAEAFW